jgi:hypothetical protein
MESSHAAAELDDLEMKHFAKSLRPACGRTAVLGRNALNVAGRLQSSPAAIRSHSGSNL